MGYRFQLAIILILGALITSCARPPETTVDEVGLEAQAWTGTTTIPGYGFSHMFVNSANALYLASAKSVSKYSDPGRLEWRAEITNIAQTEGIIRAMTLDSQNNVYVLTRHVVLRPTPLNDNAGEVQYFISKISSDGSQIVWYRLARRLFTSNIYTATFPIVTFETDKSDTLFFAIASKSFQVVLTNVWFGTFSESGTLLNSFTIPTGRVGDARARQLTGQSEWLILLDSSNGFLERRSLTGDILSRTANGFNAYYDPIKIASVTNEPFFIVSGRINSIDGSLQPGFCIRVAGGRCRQSSGRLFTDIFINPKNNDFVTVAQTQSGSFEVDSYRGVSSTGNVLKRGTIPVSTSPVVTMSSGSAIYVLENIIETSSTPDYFSQIRKYSATGVQY